MELPPVIVELLAKTTEFKAAMGEVKDEVRTTTGESSKGFNTLANIGKKAALGIGGAAVVVGVESIKMAGDFQAATSVLQTAAGESAAGLAVVRQGIKNIATSTGTSFTELEAGFYTVEKAGYRGADAVKVMTAAAQGAKEENASLSSVTNAMTSVMASYNLKATNSVQVINEIKTAAGESKTTMEQFSSSLATVIPVASSAGIGFDQVGGALATLTQHGTSAAEASQELAFTIRNLQSPSNVATKEMANLGLSSQDVQTHLGQRGLTGTMTMLSQTVLSRMGPAGTVLLNTFNTSKAAGADLVTELNAMAPATRNLAEQYEKGNISQLDFTKATKGLSGDQYTLAHQFAATFAQSQGFNTAIKNGVPGAQSYTAAMGKMLGGANGLQAALKLTGGNMAGFQARVDAIGKSARDTSGQVEGWKQTQGNFNVELDRFKNTVQVAGIDIGTWLLPKLQAFGSFLLQHKTTLAVFASLIGTTLVVAMGAWIGSLIASTAASLSAAAAAVTAAGGLGAYSTAMLLAGADTLVALAPFALIIAAVAALGVGIYELATHWSEVWGFIKRIVEDAARWVKQHATIIGAALIVLTGPIGLVIAAALQLWKHWNAVWGFITSATQAAWSFIRPILHFVVDVGLAYIKANVLVLEDVWKATWAVISAIVSTAWSILKPIFDLIVDVGLVPIKIGFALLVAAWKVGWDLISSAVDVAWKVFGPILKAVVSVGLDVIKSAVNGLRTAWSAAWDAIHTAVTTVWGYLQPVFSAVVNTGLTAISTAVGTLENVWNSAWAGVQSGVQTVYNVIKPIIDAIKSAIGGVTSAIGDLSKAAGAVKSLTGGVTGAISSVTSHLPHLAAGGIVDSPTLALIGEGGEREYVIPQSKLWATVAGIAAKGGGGMGGVPPLPAASLARAIGGGSTLTLLQRASTGATGGGASTGPMIVEAKGSGAVTLNPTYNVTVSGDTSASTLRQIEEALAAHDKDLMTMLTQRGAL